MPESPLRHLRPRLERPRAGLDIRADRAAGGRPRAILVAFGPGGRSGEGGGGATSRSHGRSWLIWRGDGGRVPLGTGAVCTAWAAPASGRRPARLSPIDAGAGRPASVRASCPRPAPSWRCSGTRPRCGPPYCPVFGAGVSRPGSRHGQRCPVHTLRPAARHGADDPDRYHVDPLNQLGNGLVVRGPLRSLRLVN